tara:strand:- start:442 stop:717 length:276 start_codon:yes stop_codon:yes gene_type:complete
MAVLGNRVIKSIQRGTSYIADDYSSTVTITAVDTDKSLLSMVGPGSMRRTSGSSAAANAVKLVLTNSTTITADSWSSLYRAYWTWEVVEYE